MQQPEIRFDGFSGELIDLNGPYVRMSELNHGKPTFRKYDMSNSSSQSVCLYFWDDRDGAQLRGWWIAPSIGGSNVWAMSAATSNLPPHSGWRIPWHAEVNKRVTLSKIGVAGNQVQPGANEAMKRPNDGNNQWGQQGGQGQQPGGNPTKQQKPEPWQKPSNPNMINPALSYGGAGGGDQGQPGAQPGASGAPGTAGQAGGGQAGAGGNQWGPASGYHNQANAMFRAGMAVQSNLHSGGMMNMEEQRRLQEEKRKEQEEKRKQVIEQTRQERKLSESVNGCVLATSNAERSFLRVKDSTSANQLFVLDIIKPADLARYSAEVDKGLRAATCSLQSAETLQSRKQLDIEQAAPMLQHSKTFESLRTQLNEAKNKLDASQKEAKEFQQKIQKRQKELWTKLVGDLVEKSQEDSSNAEQAVENLKDQSALLSSEIAEHLSPLEAIDASETATSESTKAEQVIVQGKDALTKRRTEVLTAMNFFKQTQQVTGNTDSSDPDPLQLAEKKRAIEIELAKYPGYHSEVIKIRNLASYIGTRARQAEAIRKKQEQREAGKRKLERKSKWNRQLIMDLGAEVTLCVVGLQQMEKWRQEIIELQRQGAETPENSSDESNDINGTKNSGAESEDNELNKQRKLKQAELVKEAEGVRRNLDRAKQTYSDFKSKKETLPQTPQELDRWNQRIMELETQLKDEMTSDDAKFNGIFGGLSKDPSLNDKNANGSLLSSSVTKPAAELQGSLVVAGLLIYYLEQEGKSGEDLFKEIASIKGGPGSNPGNGRTDVVTEYKMLEWVKRNNSKYFSEESLRIALRGLELPATTDPKLSIQIHALEKQQNQALMKKGGLSALSALGALGSNNSQQQGKKQVMLREIFLSHLKDAFHEADLPLNAAAGKPVESGIRNGQLSEVYFQSLYRKFYVYENPGMHSCNANGSGVPNNKENEGLLPHLCLTQSLEDVDEDAKSFPILDHRAIIEIIGQPQYPDTNDKSRVRCKVRVASGFSKYQGQQPTQPDSYLQGEQVGYLTFHCNGRQQINAMNTLKCYTETVMTEGSELKGIKTVRRVRKGEFFKLLDMSPPPANLNMNSTAKPTNMVRVMVQALSDQKSGYVTISNATSMSNPNQNNNQGQPGNTNNNNNSFYLRPELPPPPPKPESANKEDGEKSNGPNGGKSGDSSDKPDLIPISGSVRVALGEAVLAKDPATGEYKQAFLVHKFPIKGLQMDGNTSEDLKDGGSGNTKDGQPTTQTTQSQQIITLDSRGLINGKLPSEVLNYVPVPGSEEANSNQDADYMRQKVQIAWESDESLSEVYADDLRSFFDQKKKVDLSYVTKEGLQALCKNEFRTILDQSQLPTTPPKHELGFTELIELCKVELANGEKCQRKLNQFKAYTTKREIRFLVLGEPVVFASLIKEYNQRVLSNNELRIEIRDTMSEVRTRHAEILREKRQKELAELASQREEDVQTLHCELEQHTESARMFITNALDTVKKGMLEWSDAVTDNYDTADSFNHSENMPDATDDPAAAAADKDTADGDVDMTKNTSSNQDWNTIIGDITFSLREADEKKKVVTTFVEEKSIELDTKCEREKMTIQSQIDDLDASDTGVGEQLQEQINQLDSYYSDVKQKFKEIIDGLNSMMIIPGEGISIQEKLNVLKHKSSEKMLSKYVATVREVSEQKGETMEQLFNRLVAEWEKEHGVISNVSNSGGDSSTNPGSSEIDDSSKSKDSGNTPTAASSNNNSSSNINSAKILPAQAILNHFPTTTLDIQPMDLEQFVLFFSGYLVIRADQVALTEGADVQSGDFHGYIPKFSIVQPISGTSTHKDSDTQNTRRQVKVIFNNTYKGPGQLQGSKAGDVTAESDPTGTVTSSPDGDSDMNGTTNQNKTGYITVYDKEEGTLTVKMYGVLNFGGSVTLTKETILTPNSELGGKGPGMKHIRRIKVGEKLEVLSLPSLTSNNMVRIKCRALKDNVVGWLTAYHNGSKTAYVDLAE